MKDAIKLSDWVLNARYVGNNYATPRVGNLTLGFYGIHILLNSYLPMTPSIARRLVGMASSQLQVGSQIPCCEKRDVMAVASPVIEPERVTTKPPSCPTIPRCGEGWCLPRVGDGQFCPF